ncbi:Receptor-like protein 9DC3 [Camellia lanceoleosa]|uniref:Receptor-like protein 9DC3 n=1 Tax=Camellia lanceoleosa TaxID=1840588 RepID=A0ACC0GBN9_9ERIC|nr:Receptor-like protein 9DC3 [Camellia lanceoleosa]
MIPTGSQIQTFSDTSFQGNKGLCGYPLNISCKNASPVPSLVLRSDRVPVECPLSLEPKIFKSAAVGFVVGLGIFIGLLVCCKRWNECFFKHVEQVLERISIWKKNKKEEIVDNELTEIPFGDFSGGGRLE